MAGSSVRLLGHRARFEASNLDLLLRRVDASNAAPKMRAPRSTSRGDKNPGLLVSMLPRAKASYDHNVDATAMSKRIKMSAGHTTIQQE